MDIFATRLKELREGNKFTQKEMAEKLGFTQSYYAKFEYGQREPNIETILKLSEIFNCSVDYLLGRDKFVNTTAEDYVRPPMLEGIKNGMLKYSDDEDRLPLPPHVLRGREGFTLKVTNDSMMDSGIYEENIVIALFQDHLNDNDVAVVSIDGNDLIIRDVTRDGDLYILSPSQTGLRPQVIEASKLIIIGKVIGVFKMVSG